MATDAKGVGAAKGVTSNVGGTFPDMGKDEWQEYRPKTIVREDALPPARVAEIWEVLKKIAGVSDEKGEKMLKLAVYAYACANGTSRAGRYSVDVVMGNGNTFPAAAIIQTTGKFNVRRFFRGDMRLSYDYLKKSQVMAADQRFVTERETAGVPGDVAFATADWFDGCPWFTPEESQAHASWRKHSLARAHAARDGKSLEEIVDDSYTEREPQPKATNQVAPNNW